MFTPEKLAQIVSLAETLVKETTNLVSLNASKAVSLTLYEVSQDIDKYRVLLQTLESHMWMIEGATDKNSRIVDMYPALPSQRPAGTSDLLFKLEFQIYRELDNNALELKEIMDFVEHMIYFVEHQQNNKIIKSFLTNNQK